MGRWSRTEMGEVGGGKGGMGLYVEFGFGARPALLVPFYGLIGVGSLAKGAAGFVPLAIVLVDVITTHGVVGLKRLVSIPGWIMLAALAVPWWIMSAVAGGRQRFVHGVVLNDQLLAYFGREPSGWRTIAHYIDYAAPATHPWALQQPLRS